MHSQSGEIGLGSSHCGLRKQILPAHSSSSQCLSFVQYDYGINYLAMDRVPCSGFDRWLDRKTNPELAPNLPKNNSQKTYRVSHSGSFYTGPKRVYSRLESGGWFVAAARSG